MRNMLFGLMVVVAAVCAVSPARAQTTPAGSCDRACLNRIADAYIAALVAHDPSKAPMAPVVTFTEQAQVLAVGEGLWKTAAEGPTTFKIPVADPGAAPEGAEPAHHRGGASDGPDHEPEPARKPADAATCVLRHGTGRGAQQAQHPAVDC